MLNIIFVILSLVKILITIIFLTLAFINLYKGFKNNDSKAKGKAITYFLLPFAIIIGITAIEFATAYLYHS